MCGALRILTCLCCICLLLDGNKCGFVWCYSCVKEEGFNAVKLCLKGVRPKSRHIALGGAAEGHVQSNGHALCAFPRCFAVQNPAHKGNPGPCGVIPAALALKSSSFPSTGPS